MPRANSTSRSRGPGFAEAIGAIVDPAEGEWHDVAMTLRVLALALLLASSLWAHSQQAPQYPALLAVDDRSRIAPVSKADLIGFALYTVQDGVLKLSAHLYPLGEDDEPKVTLEVQRDGEWQAIATADVHPIGWTALFRVEGWDATQSVPYRVRHAGGAQFDGLIRADPIDKRTIVAAAFTGNSPGPGGGKISKQDVVDAVRKLDPDVLLFTGDQVYNHVAHTQHWLEFGAIFKDILRDRPTVCLPDDHDVGQPNLWGQGGRKTDRDTKGGYTRPAEYVKLIERQQTSHLPDPVDPTPIEQGIGVYFTRLIVGGIDFALIEDRKFKSGCFGIVTDDLGPRPDHVDNPEYDPKAFDLPGKELLGPRQERFLAEWATDWVGAQMKSVVSQTTFAMASNYHGGDRTFYYCDFDANGWPQTARRRAVALLRSASAFHICGDQHLATIVQYGIDDWRDAGFSFCVPSIANLWPRWWAPNQPARNAEPGAEEYTGDYFDGFGNRLTVFAHTNPRKSGREPAELLDRMPGFGVVRFDKQTRAIRIECWPRMVDPTDPAAQQYRGWPRTISQFDNLGRQAFALPELVIQGAVDPIVQLVDDGGTILYTVRIAGSRAVLPAPRDAMYTLRLKGAGEWRVRAAVTAYPVGTSVPALEIDLR